MHRVDVARAGYRTMKLAGDGLVELSHGELDIVCGFIGWVPDAPIVRVVDLQTRLEAERGALETREDAGDLALVFIESLVRDALELVRGGHA